MLAIQTHPTFPIFSSATSILCDSDHTLKVCPFWALFVFSSVRRDHWFCLCKFFAICGWRACKNMWLWRKQVVLKYLLLVIENSQNSGLAKILLLSKNEFRLLFWIEYLVSLNTCYSWAVIELINHIAYDKWYFCHSVIQHVWYMSRVIFSCGGVTYWKWK